ncbi:3762_t:CDS:2 [Paraglomus occultum]|uniref:3762_t:CDS:1 n=1 Tax=Paraglomus occultum TaxID=144539 RepID=A0A9N9B8B1_9GLOM|nr:3762_t:CDS:2 [Paraglomus occultum]
MSEGVLVAKKDFNAPKHPDIDVPNLQVIKACQSLESRGYVKTQFSWQYYYYSLTSEGIDYLREYLHLPPEIIPTTLKKQARPPPPMRGGRSAVGFITNLDFYTRPNSLQLFSNFYIETEGGDSYRGPRDRDTYRRRDDNKEGASGDFKPEFKRRGPRPSGDN